MVNIIFDHLLQQGNISSECFLKVSETSSNIKNIIDGTLTKTFLNIPNFQFFATFKNSIFGIYMFLLNVL